MSEASITTVAVQEQTTTTPEQTLAAVALPTPEQAVAEQAAGAAEQAAQDEAKAREEADRTLKAAGKACKQGEKAYRAGQMEAGRLGDLYLHQRMALNDKRAVAVQALEGELAKWSSTKVDEVRLIGCYHAYRLLAQEQGIKEDVPYGHYRDAWKQLVVRQAKDTVQEHWTLLPGVEDQARELFATAVKDGLSKEAVAEQVKVLQRQYTALQADKAKQAEAEARDKAQAQKANAQQARQEAILAVHKAEQADAKAQAAPQEQKAELTAAAERAREELLAKQRAMTEAQAKADAEARAAARAEADRKAKQDAEAKAVAKEVKAQQRAADKAAGKTGTVSENLLAVAAAGTAKDVAEQIAELFAQCDTPDDLLQHLLGMLADCKALSAKGKRAAQAALTVLTRTDKAAALPAPAANGAVAVA